MTAFLCRVALFMVSLHSSRKVTRITLPSLVLEVLPPCVSIWDPLSISWAGSLCLLWSSHVSYSHVTYFNRSSQHASHPQTPPSSHKSHCIQWVTSWGRRALTEFMLHSSLRVSEPCLVSRKHFLRTFWVKWTSDQGFSSIKGTNSERGQN